MNQKAITAFKSIFPNGDYALFLHYFNFWHNVDYALWSYGEVRFSKTSYERERAILKAELMR